MLGTLWNLGKEGMRKMIDVRTTKYWKVEMMKEEKRMARKQRTPPTSLEGKEEVITEILDSRTTEEKEPRVRKDGEKTNKLLH